MRALRNNVGRVLLTAVLTACATGRTRPSVAASTSRVTHGVRERTPPTVAYLTDSVEATDMELTLRRVEVRHASGRVDTVSRILTETEPVVVGDSVVLGVAQDSAGAVVSLFRWHVATRALVSLPIPPALEAVMNGLSGLAIAPNGEHLLSVDFDARGTARGVVRRLRDGAVVMRAPAEAMAPMDGRLADAEWQNDRVGRVHMLVQDLPTTAVTQTADLVRQRWSVERTIDSTGSQAMQTIYDAVDALVHEARGELGVSVALLEHPGTAVIGGHRRYPMQSVYKLPIAMSESDGSACDVLLRLLGGPHVVRAWLLRHGVREIEVRNTEREIGANDRVQYENWATPQGAMTLLRSVHTNRAPNDDTRPLLTATSHALVMEWLTRTPTGAKRLRGLLPAGTVVAHKTGTSGTANGVTAATNDIGIITLPDGRHLGVAVFLRDSRLDEAGREAIIARVAKAAWGAYVK